MRTVYQHILEDSSPQRRTWCTSGRPRQNIRVLERIEGNSACVEDIFRRQKAPSFCFFVGIHRYSFGYFFLLWFRFNVLYINY